MAKTLEIGRLSPRLTGRTDHIAYPKSFILSHGNLTKGFVFYGPFKTKEALREWARCHLEIGNIYTIQSIYRVDRE